MGLHFGGTHSLIAQCRVCSKGGGGNSALLRTSATGAESVENSHRSGAAWALSRAEASLCLLAEVALQHADTLRPHLPVLLLICLIKADAAHPIVHGSARRVRDPTCSCAWTTCACMLCVITHRQEQPKQARPAIHTAMLCARARSPGMVGRQGFCLKLV